MSDVPPTGWVQWGEQRVAEMRGPQFGLEAMLRAFRHPGRMIVRPVAQERSVLAWRPDNPLIRATVCRGGRPKHRMGSGVSVPVAHAHLVIPGDVTTIRTQDSHHLIIENATPQYWIDGLADYWDGDATGA